MIIGKQGELIELMRVRNEDMFKEKTDLQAALLDSQEATVRASDHNVLWGVVGVALGVVAAGLLHK